MKTKTLVLFSILCLVALFGLVTSMAFGADLLNLRPEELVQADGSDIDVGKYSVPSFVDWDNDYLGDLVIGCGDGKVRVYLNNGTEAEPIFSDFFYAQSVGADLYCEPSGCMGCFPRVVYWDADDLKDLLVGQSAGTLKLFLNINTDSDPSFDGGTLLQVGPLGSKVNIEVGGRPTPTVIDWNNDDKKDLVLGAIDGKIHIFLNEGTDTEPDFIDKIFAQDGDIDLVVPSFRSSPVIFDADNDGKKDLIVGNTNGELLLYSNVGSDADPSFSGFVPVESTGVPIVLVGTPRSRPYVCYWTGDGHFGPKDVYPDVLIGAYDGNVHLYQGIIPLTCQE